MEFRSSVIRGFLTFKLSDAHHLELPQEPHTHVVNVELIPQTGALFLGSSSERHTRVCSHQKLENDAGPHPPSFSALSAYLSRSQKVSP